MLLCLNWRSRAQSCGSCKHKAEASEKPEKGSNYKSIQKLGINTNVTIKHWNNVSLESGIQKDKLDVKKKKKESGILYSWLADRCWNSMWLIIGKVYDTKCHLH